MSTVKTRDIHVGSRNLNPPNWEPFDWEDPLHGPQVKGEVVVICLVTPAKRGKVNKAKALDEPPTPAEHRVSMSLKAPRLKRAFKASASCSRP